MASLKDIARICGVSVATVSKALNGQPDIGEETRKRVTAAAEELGYFTNSAARALKTNRTNNIGVLFFDAKKSGLSHEFFSTMLESFKVEAEAHGYDITFINNAVIGQNATYLQHCRYRGFDGVIIASVNFSDPRVAELVASDIPLVTVDHVFNSHSAVLSDNIAGIDALVKYAYSMGHRKIAFIHGENTSVTSQRLASFYRCCDSLGIEVPGEYIAGSDYHDPDKCCEAMEKMLSLDDRPDCILVPDDYSYLGAVRAAGNAGLSIPGDISIMGYDGIRLSQLLTPRLTTYRQDTAEMGRLAAEKLIYAIEKPNMAIAEHITVSGSLITGETVKDLR